MRTGVAAIAVIVAAAGVARADDQDVPALIALVKAQPASMDRTEWKEKRRDAARKLGQLGDRRAVPVLIDVVETETFDIVGEIAIEALGQLGDPAAVPVLQQVAGDESRDTAQRDKARAALKKLGAGTGTDAGAGTGGDDVAEHPIALPPLGGGAPDGAVPEGPRWGDDVLAATERLTFALGSATFDWDSVQHQLDLDLDVAATYARSVDRERSAWALGGDARVVAGTADPEGRASARALIATAEGHGEYRAYWNDKVYGLAIARARLEGSKLAVQGADPADDNSDRWLALDGTVAIGGGWGRVLDVGTRLRVARIAAALERDRQLGRPIDDEVARRLQSAWWATRGELGAHRRLTATVAILRDAGVLLGEPDAGTTYELLQVLDDPGLDQRLDGIDVHLALAENYLARWRYPSDEDANVPEGRLEEVLLEATVGHPLGLTRDVSGDAYARYRLFAPTGAPSPWAIGARARLRSFVYGEHEDPRGALDLTAELALSDDDLGDATDLGMRVGGEVGWTMFVSRASSIRLAGTATVDAGELFLGASLQGAYGMLDGTFAMSPP